MAREGRDGVMLVDGPGTSQHGVTIEPLGKPHSACPTRSRYPRRSTSSWHFNLQKHRLSSKLQIFTHRIPVSNYLEFIFSSFDLWLSCLIRVPRGHQGSPLTLITRPTPASSTNKHRQFHHQLSTD